MITQGTRTTISKYPAFGCVPEVATLPIPPEFAACDAAYRLGVHHGTLQLCRRQSSFLTVAAQAAYAAGKQVGTQIKQQQREKLWLAQNAD